MLPRRGSRYVYRTWVKHLILAVRVALDVARASSKRPSSAMPCAAKASAAAQSPRADSFVWIYILCTESRGILGTRGVLKILGDVREWIRHGRTLPASTYRKNHALN